MRNTHIILLLLSFFLLPGVQFAQTVVLKTDTVAVPCTSSDTFLVPVKVLNFNNLGGLQFSIEWDKTLSKFIHVQDFNPLLANGFVNMDSTTHINKGQITFAWLDPGGLTIPNTGNNLIFNMAFVRLGGAFSPVAFDTTALPFPPPTAVTVSDPNFNALPFALSIGGVKTIDAVPPTISCPPSVTISSNSPVAVSNIAPASLTDNCGLDFTGWSSTGATTASSPMDPNASGAVFNPGISTVQYTTQDLGGNTATCTFSINIEADLNAADTLTFIVGSGTANCGNVFFADVTTNNFDSIFGAQFSLQWATNVLKFDSVGLFNAGLNITLGNFNTSAAQNGNIPGNGNVAFGWNSDDFSAGTSVPDGTRLFRIYFTVTGIHSSTTSIDFVDFPAALLSINPALEPLPTIYIDGGFEVEDNTNPVIQCPANQTVVALGQSSATVSGLAPLSLTDNCSGNINLTYMPTTLGNGAGNGPANGTYPAGTNTVTYTATDLAGNTSTCSFLVTVDPGEVFQLAIDSVQYNCGGNGIVSFPFRVENFDDIGGLNFRVEWDPAVLSYTGFSSPYPGTGITGASFPSASMTSPLGYVNFLRVDPNGQFPNIPDGGVLFNLNFMVLNQNATSNLTFQQPTNAINGSFTSVPFDFVGGYFESVDITPPAITCPTNIAVQSTMNCVANVTLPAATATDACGTPTTINNGPISGVYPAGPTVVTYIATDGAGNSSSCTMTVTVTANTALAFTNCPTAPIVLSAGNDCSEPLVYPTLTATNPCITNANFNYNYNFPVGTVRPVGTTNVVVTATQLGNGGGFVTCNFQVQIVDDTPPVLTCPAPITLDAVGNDCYVIDPVLPLPGVTDNCTTLPEISIDSTTIDTLFVGANTIAFFAEDAAGNQSSCTFQVTVHDVAPPTLICPPTVTVSASADCSAMANWSLPVVNDNCTEVENIQIVGTGNPGSLFMAGSNVVQYTATDQSGNSTTCTFSVDVLETTPPVITGCPNSIFVLLPITKCDTVVSWIPPTAADNCGIDTFYTNYEPFTIFPSGSTTVIYTATDLSGNTSTCSFIVSALDEIAPVFTTFPSDIVITNADPCGAPLNIPEPTASDNCDPDPQISYSGTLQGIFPIGQTVIEFLVKDASGNITKDTLTVTVSSALVKSFGNIPSNQVFSNCTAVATWTAPTVQGFCEPPVVTSNYNSGDTFPLGTTTVIYTATETNGSTITASFTITVNDPAPPQIACPQPVVVNAVGVVISDPSDIVNSISTANGCQGANLDLSIPAVTDECDFTPELTQISGPAPVGVFPVGAQTLTYQATDEFGNSSTCSYTVEVLPFVISAPVVEPNPGCEGEMVVLSVTAYPNATYTWTGPQTSYPNAPVVTILSLSSGNTGAYSVTASLNGCSATAGPVEVLMAVKPIAEDDISYSVAIGDTLTGTSVLLNDDFVLASDLVISLQNEVPGLDFNTTDGTFKYLNTTNPGMYSFVYEICSVACPDLCDLATVTITVRDNKCDFVPNIFTPNNDQSNDYFKIPCLDSGLYPNNSLVIYNQWGDKVFEADGYDNSVSKAWNGTLNNEAGKDLPDGVYYYIFKQDSNAPALKGFVHIYR